MSISYFTPARPVKAACYILNMGACKMRVRATHRGILELLLELLPQPGRTREVRA